MNNITQAISLLKRHTKLISHQFVISDYQNKPIWSSGVLEEVSYLLLIAYVNLMQSDDMDNHKRTLIDKVVDEWAGIITGILNHQNTPQNKIIIKQRLNEKSVKYTPIIDKILGERLDNNPDDEVFYKYELYELFIQEIKDNFNTRFCQRPNDGLMGAMNFINLSEDNTIINEEVFDERSVIMLSLKYDDVDEINEHDKIAITKNQNKKDIKKRALVIRDGVVNFLTNCIYEHNQNNQSQNQYYDYASSDNHSTKQHSNYYDNNISSQKPSFWSFGRMKRTTYALFSIPTLLVVLIMRVAMEGAVSSMDSYSGADLFLMTIIELLPLYFLIFLGIKRLHDCDYKGWWILVPFVVAVIWFVRPTQGANRFGADPREDYSDGDIEIESDYSFWGVVAISLLINISLINNALEMQKSQMPSVEQNHTPIYQDNKSNNIQTPTISPNDIQTPNTNNEPPLNPQLILAEAQKRYEKSVTNINAVWNSLHPSTQEFLRAEQRAINKKREADCTAYGNSQSSDKDLAKAYRYLCEISKVR